MYLKLVAVGVNCSRVVGTGLAVKSSFGTLEGLAARHTEGSGTFVGSIGPGPAGFVGRTFAAVRRIVVGARLVVAPGIAGRLGFGHTVKGRNAVRCVRNCLLALSYLGRPLLIYL